jgi:hypothetical protein
MLYLRAIAISRSQRWNFTTSLLTQLEGGDAEDAIEAQRRDRAGIHARGLEHG